MSITAARPGISDDVHTRQVRYATAMGIRAVMFVLAVVVPGGWFKFACVLGAVVLPYFSVVYANGGREAPGAGPDTLLDLRERPALQAHPNTASGQTKP